VIKHSLGERQLIVNNKTIELIEPLRYIETFNESVIVVFYRGNRDISHEPLNNMNAYDIHTGELIWNIKELIGKNEECKQWHIKKTLFFNMKKENGILYAYDFIYHFYINPIERRIVKVKAHR
jgi:hypothetical protein